MNVVIDYDGTITGNYAFYIQLCSMLIKSGHTVTILTACKPSRRKDVYIDLEKKGVPYHQLISRPKDVTTGPSSLGEWKKNMLESIRADVWFDNEIKNYEDAGVDFNTLSTQKVRA